MGRAGCPVDKWYIVSQINVTTYKRLGDTHHVSFPRRRFEEILTAHRLVPQEHCTQLCSPLVFI